MSRAPRSDRRVLVRGVAPLVRVLSLVPLLASGAVGCSGQRPAGGIGRPDGCVGAWCVDAAAAAHTQTDGGRDDGATTTTGPEDAALSDALVDVADGVAVDGSSARDGDPDTGGGGGLSRVRAARFSEALHLSSFASSRAAAASGLASGGGRLVAVNPDSDTITVVQEEAPFWPILAEIAVGDDPRTLAVTGDGRYAAVVNRGDATVSLVDLEARRELFYFDVGPMPYGIVLVGTTAYVTEMARGELAVLNLETRAAPTAIALGDTPAGIAACLAPHCTLPGGDSLLVTHFYSGLLTIIARSTLDITATVSTGADTNLSQFVMLAADGGRAYLPQTRFNADNPNRQFDTTVFPVVNVVELAPAAGGRPRLLNADRITLDTADRPVGMPFAVALSADANTLWVANAASDDLSVIDLTTQSKRAHIEVGANPRSVILSDDGRWAYVNETLDGTLAVIDTATFRVQARVPLTRLPLDAQTLAGKRLFHSAQRVDLARDQWMACATCHFDGFTDRRTWLSFPDGPRNTTALFNLEETLPLHWSGDLNEVQDVEATIRFIQAGTGLAPAPQIDTLGPTLAGASADLDALSAFIRAIPAPPSPFLDDAAAIARGKEAFENLSCVTCHPPPRYTDRARHDVATGDPDRERNSHGHGTAFDTPSLRALWLTPPYLHDGSAATLDDVFSRGTDHDLRSRSDTATRAALVAFLRSL